MTALILQHAINFLFVIMAISVYALHELALRQRRGLRVPQFFADAHDSGTYYVCMAWITLFFAAHFMFSYRDPILHWCSVPSFIVSLLYWPLYRNRVEVLRFRSTRYR